MKFHGGANALLKAVGNPPFIYGTAWKKGETTRLVTEALSAGFTAVDTAAQPRHYREDLVGAALRDAFKSGMKREDIYLQTKYTSPQGQDANNMPYDASAPLETQIHTSVASSLRNLRPTDDPNSTQDHYIDCLLLHSPLQTARATLDAWKILEGYVPQKIRHLGISNVTLPMLELLYNNSNIKPAVVQNRFYAATRYDVPLRKSCRENGIMYQSFWTLTGNPKLLTAEPVMVLAKAAGISMEVALYSLVMSLDVVVLNGTTSARRMKEDLEGVMRVKEWAGQNAERWEHVRQGFRALVEPH